MSVSEVRGGANSDYSISPSIKWFCRTFSWHISPHVSPHLVVLTEEQLDWPTQLKFALYAVRSTPNRSTGFSPFELVYGKNLRSPLDLLLDELDPKTTRNTKALEWLEELDRRVAVLREAMVKNVRTAQSKRKDMYDKGAVVRTFKKGEMVLTRLPGLQNKLEGGYEGPYEILEVPNDVHVIIGIPGKAGGNKIKHVHINSCKPYNQVQVCRVAVWAREDEIVDSVSKKLEGDVLTDYRQKELDAVLRKWGDVLSDIPGKTDILKHDIRTGDSLPVRSIPYQIPSKWRSQVKEELEKMQEQGILGSSTSAWSAPIVPVPKKSGEIRVCGDFRKLNKITEVDSYHIPFISEIIERVGNSSVLSKMDMCKGFHQVAMADDAREKTAIVTPFGKMEYSRMPFGLVNDTSTFKRLMDIVLDGLQHMCSAYVDDIIVYSWSWEEHLKDIDTVLGRLKKVGLTAKPCKCEWGKQYLVFLGHKIGGGKVAVPENRARSVAEYVRPKNKKGVRAFLGLAGYYRRFVPNFGSLAVPLTKMTKKGMPDCVKWAQRGWYLV